MPRQRASSTARGYGSQHQRIRKQLLARWRPGDPCARCGQPMTYRWLLYADGRRVSAIDLGHTDDRSGYTGLEHRHCNRRDGQAKTTAINRARGPMPARQLSAIRIKQWQASAAQAGRRTTSQPAHVW